MAPDPAASSAELLAAAADAFAALRERTPRVHVITNTVVQPVTANLLIAAGAVPSMTVAPEEVPDFASRADALLVNLGTLDAGRRSAVTGALDVVGEEGTPWVLDPVFVDVSTTRLGFAQEIMKREPWVVRCNEAEARALSAGEGSRSQLADRLALEAVTVVTLTGAVDLITNGSRRAQVENGNPLLAQITGSGCAGSALTAAFMAVTSDPFIAALGAAAVIGVAAEDAAQSAEGPGSFGWRLIDALASLSPSDLSRRARIA